MIPENNLENQGARNVKRPKNSSFPDSSAKLRPLGITITRKEHDLIFDILALPTDSLDSILERQNHLMQAVRLVLNH